MSSASKQRQCKITNERAAEHNELVIIDYPIKDKKEDDGKGVLIKSHQWFTKSKT